MHTLCKPCSNRAEHHTQLTIRPSATIDYAPIINMLGLHNGGSIPILDRDSGWVHLAFLQGGCCVLFGSFEHELGRFCMIIFKPCACVLEGSYVKIQSPHLDSCDRILWCDCKKQFQVSQTEFPTWTCNVELFQFEFMQELTGSIRLVGVVNPRPARGGVGRPPTNPPKAPKEILDPKIGVPQKYGRARWGGVAGPPPPSRMVWLRGFPRPWGQGNHTRTQTCKQRSWVSSHTLPGRQHKLWGYLPLWPSIDHRPNCTLWDNFFGGGGEDRTTAGGQCVHPRSETRHSMN